MKASFEGHVDIVRLLIEAKAQLNRQTEKVIVIYTESHAVFTNILDCVSVHSMASLLFLQLLRRAGLLW